MSAAAFAAVDWGTSSFRLWLIADDGSVLAERRSDEGMMSAARTGFAAILSAHLRAAEAPDGLPVVICGMAGSRQGWVEAAYLDVPARLDAIVDNAVAVPDAPSHARILPGLAQRIESDADVMRGEETQLLGAVDALSAGNADGLICIPGTHSKWVRLRGGQVEAFSTFMTGELFAVMGAHSILAHTLSQAPVDPENPAFATAVKEGCAYPCRVTAKLFSIRGGQLLFAHSPEIATARLSGLLIGAELADNVSTAAGPVRLIASGKLRALYEAAIGAVGVGVDTVDADEAVRGGLTLAARTLFFQD